MPLLTRPDTLPSKTHRIPIGFGNLYVTISEHEGKPVEVFAYTGKCGQSIMAKAEVTGRLISLALRHDIPVELIVRQIIGISGEHPVMHGKDLIKSIPDAIGQLLQRLYVKAPLDASQKEL